MTLSEPELRKLRQQMAENWNDAEPEPIYHLPEEKLPALISQAEIVERFGLTTLDALTTAHMTAAQAQKYSALLRRVREWRDTDKSFFLCSETKGIGKTHIARAVYDSFGSVYGWSDNEWKHYGRAGHCISARELMAILSDKTAAEWVSRSWPVLVIDDIGREGNIKYVAAADQRHEVQDRYYDLINHCYTRNVRVFVTGNYSLTDMAAGKGPFNDATWSRMLEMCGRGHIVELSGYTDYRRVLGGF